MTNSIYKNEQRESVTKLQETSSLLDHDKCVTYNDTTLTTAFSMLYCDDYHHVNISCDVVNKLHRDRQFLEFQQRTQVHSLDTHTFTTLC